MTKIKNNRFVKMTVACTIVAAEILAIQYVLNAVVEKITPE